MAKAPAIQVSAQGFAGATTGAIVIPDYVDWEGADGNPNPAMVSFVFTAKCNGVTGTIGNIRATWALGANLQTKRTAIRTALNGQLSGTEPGVSLAEAAIEVSGIPT